MKKIVLTSLVFILFTGFAFAQNEVLRERSSLNGITEFGLVINIEKPIGLIEESLDIITIKKLIVENLSDLSINIIDEKTLQKSDEYPIFHLHLNVMHASNNTFPYAIEMNFYQPVKLMLNRDMQTMASTWNSGQVGIVSRDLLSNIAIEAVQATNTFKSEFQKMNK